jgi:hypothetical protein
MGIVYQSVIEESAPIAGLGFVKGSICDEPHCIFGHLNLNVFQRFYHLKVLYVGQGVAVLSLLKGQFKKFDLVG